MAPIRDTFLQSPSLCCATNSSQQPQTIATSEIECRRSRIRQGQENISELSQKGPVHTMGRGVQQRFCDDGGIEVIREPSGLQVDLSCFDPAGDDDLQYSVDGMSRDDDGSAYLPLPKRRPNRKSALIEDVEDEITVPSLNFQSKGTQHPTFHPALKAAIIAEGQEAMWIEDEISTTTEIVVDEPPSPPPKPPVEIQSKPKKRLSTFMFGSKRPEAVPEEEPVKQEETAPRKMQVKKKKVKKAVVLLPQHGGGGAKALADANVAQEAAVNMVKARQLLQQALVAEGTPRLLESEKMAKVAFAHANTARRLMSAPAEGPRLDEVLYTLTEKGEHAAYQHQKIVFSQSFEDTPKHEDNGNVSEFASKAIHYLESILPKNVDQEIEEVVSDDVWTEEGLSSLGFATDTFEYKLNQEESRQVSMNMDLVSLSSLNEILDGPIDDENRPPSPRQVLPVIDVPSRQTKRKKSANDRTEQTVSAPNDVEADNENVPAKANGVGVGSSKQSKPQRRSLPNMTSKSSVPRQQGKGLKGGDPTNLTKAKSKWGVFSNILGKRQGPQAQKQKQTGAHPVGKGKQGQRKPKGAAVLKKTESLPSGSKNSTQTKITSGKPECPVNDKPKVIAVLQRTSSAQSSLEGKNPIQEKGSSEKPSHAASVLPSLQSNSLDSDIDEGSKIDRYNSTQSKQSEEEEEQVETSNSYGKPKSLSVETEAQENAAQTVAARAKTKEKNYQDLHIQQGKSSEYNMKSLNTNDWDENVHRHPSQSLSIETSNDDWDEGVHKLPTKCLDPIVSDQNSNDEKTRLEVGTKDQSKVGEHSGMRSKPQETKEENDASGTHEQERDIEEKNGRYAPARTRSNVDEIQNRDISTRRNSQDVDRQSNPRTSTHINDVQASSNGSAQRFQDNDTRRNNNQDTWRQSDHRKVGDLNDTRIRSHRNKHSVQEYRNDEYMARDVYDQRRNGGYQGNDQTEKFQSERRTRPVDGYPLNAGERIPSNQKRGHNGPVEPVDTEDARRAKIEDDSLINFVISPGRLELPSDMKINTNVLGYGDTAATPVKPLSAAEHQLSAVHQSSVTEKPKRQPDQKGIKPESKNPKIISRIAGIFGGKSRNKKQSNNDIDLTRSETSDEDPHIETSASNEKDLEQAISDGNMRAVEANENAEDAPVSGLQKKTKKMAARSTLPAAATERPENLKSSEHIVSKTSGKVDGMKHRSSNQMKLHAQQVSEDSIAQAIRKGSSRAEEENKDDADDVDPLLQHLRSLNRQKHGGRKSENGGNRSHRRDHDRMPLATDRRKTDPGSLEQMIRSKSKDPSNVEKKASPGKGAGAPTPRRSDKIETAPTPRRSEKSSRDDKKYDQKAITARLYGGGDTAAMSRLAETEAIGRRSEPSRKSRHQTSHKPRQESRQPSHKPRQGAKHVYIGDLVGSSNPARTMSTQASEESLRETRHRPADPSVCGDRRRVRRGTDPS